MDALAIRARRAHEVDARDVRVHVLRDVQAHHLGTELRIGQDQVGRHDACAQDVLAVVDVVDEAVERRDTLHQAAPHAAPFLRGDDARNQVEGDQPLGPGALLVLVAIHGEGDAHAAEDHLGLRAAGLHGIGRLLRQPLAVMPVVRPHVAAPEGQHGVHLVELLHAACLLTPG